MNRMANRLESLPLRMQVGVAIGSAVVISAVVIQVISWLRRESEASRQQREEHEAEASTCACA